jgi:hypothetical protein
VTAAAKPAGGAAGAGLSAEQKQQLAALKAKALGQDFGETLEAIRKIVAMGPVVREELNGLLVSLLTRNKAAIESAVRAAGAMKGIEQADKKLAEARAEARANIAKLSKHDGTIPKAWDYNRKLIAATKRLAPTMAARSRLLDAAGRRLRLLDIQRRVLAGTPKAAAAGADRSALLLIEEMLGISLKGVKRLDGLKEAPALKGLWAFRLNRTIYAYNRRICRTMHWAEAQNVVTVNDYREALGLLRMEADPRLVQAARRHSKEMADLGYFGHESPTPDNRSFSRRAKNAGYPSAAGENCAAGTRDGVKAFGTWFGSPPHHRNMVGASHTAIGVGKWGHLWTQNFGRAKRLVKADDAAPTPPKPKGTILPPQR